MAEAIPFPYISPSTRVYTAGEYPTKYFEAANGATTAIRYGNRRHRSKLQATFEGISDDKALEILNCYRDTMEKWDYIRFNRGDDGVGGRGGMWEGIYNQTLIERWYQENFTAASQTYWRFESPPVVTSLYPGICSVSCSFISYLDPE